MIPPRTPASATAAFPDYPDGPNFWELCLSCDGQFRYSDETLDLGTVYPVGTTFVLPHTWGRDETKDLTEEQDIEFVARRDMTLHEAVLRLISLYVASVYDARFYFIESVEVQPDGKVCVDYGT